MGKLFILLPLLWILNSCTTEGSQIEDVALDEAKSQLKTEMKTALEERMKGKDILKENYLNKILDRTEVTIGEVSKSAASAKVQVKIKTVPLKVREALTDIMIKLDPAQENNFNVPDALAMISKQLGVEPSAGQEIKKDILLKKDSVWKLQSAPAPNLTK